MAESSGRNLIRDIVEAIEKRIPTDDCLMINDTFKSGNPDDPVTGIVVTFMAARQVLQKAAGLKAILIITHETTFYGGQDETDWLAQYPLGGRGSQHYYLSVNRIRKMDWPGPIVDNSSDGTDTFSPDDPNSTFKIRHIRIFKPEGTPLAGVKTNAAEQVSAVPPPENQIWECFFKNSRISSTLLKASAVTVSAAP